MRTARNTLFRAAVINYALIFLVWCLSMTGWYINVIEHFTGLGGMTAYLFVLNFLSMWKVLTTVFFLVPALAIWWQMCADEKKARETGHGSAIRKK